MRILLLSQFYPPIIGGEERHVRNLGAALTQRGHHVSVATLWYPGASDSEMDGDVQVVRIRGTLQRVSTLFSESERRHAPPFPDPELVAGLARVLRQERPDIVHAHNWMVHAYLPLKPFFPARLVQTLHDYSLICAKKQLMRDDGPCSGPGVSKCLSCAKQHYGAVKGGVTYLANQASSVVARRMVDKFLAVSHAVADLNGLGGAGSKCDVVPNFVSDDVGVLAPEPDPRMRQLPAGSYLLFVGDLNRQKGVSVLLEAYCRLRRAPPLVLIGRASPDGPRDLPAKVHVFSAWPHAAVMQAWQRCQFGIAPSVGQEACSTVVIEGMALGKPMIVTAVGGMPDLVEHEQNGLIVPPDDAGALAAAMQRLIDDDALRQRLATGSLERVETLKARSVVDRIEVIYRNLVINGQRALQSDERFAQ